MEIELPQINRRLTAAILIAGFALLMLSLLHSKFPVFMDEAIFSDMVNRFNQGLGFSTLLFKDFMPYVEKYSYWYPPLYFLTLAPVYQLFGASITVMRLFSLFFGVVTLIFIYLWSRDIFKFKYSVLLVLLILVSDFYFQDASIVGRMEMFTIAAGMAALFFHQLYINNKKQKWNFLSGFFSVYSLLSHPTSVIILFPIAINLLFLKKDVLKDKLKAWIIYGLPILIGVLIWVVSFWPNRNIFLMQNAIQLHRKQYAPIYVFEIFKFKPFHRLVLLIYFLSNFIFAARVVINKDRFKPQNRLLLGYAVTSTFLPVLMKEMWYLVYISIFGAVLLVINLEHWQQKGWKWLSGGILSCLLLLNLFIFFTTLDPIIKNPDNYWSISEKISQHIPLNSKVIMSSLPDPFFYFEDQRPDLTLRVTPNSPESEPIDADVYNRIFEDVDYAVMSYFLNIHISSYIQNNMDKIVFDNREVESSAVMVIKLKPVEERQPLNPPDEKTWTYPQL